MRIGMIFCVGLLFGLSQIAKGQIDSTLFVDTFSYGTGSDITQIGGSNWISYAGTTPTVEVFSGGLAYGGYEHDGAGNRMLLTNAGQAVYKAHASIDISSGTIYAAFLMKSTSVGTVGHYFFHFGYDLSAPVGTPYGLLYVKDDGSGNLQFAIQKNDGPLSSYTGSGISASNPHLVVVAYKFVGGGSNDTMKVWVDPPTQTGTESQPLIVFDDPLDPDVASLDGVVFWQLGDPDDSRQIEIAGLRVTYSWEEATLPVQLTNFAAVANRSGVDLTWSTATEVNNYGFEIERRAVQGSGIEVQGNGAWTVVGFVRGAGTSTTPQEYSYSDFGLAPGRYAYRIKQIDFGGTSTYYSATEVEVGAMPKELALEPNYPNPFNPSTNISFTVPQDGPAVLKVFNMLGQEVATLFNEEAVAGRLYKATFDASSLPTGVYVSRLEFGGQAVMQKMLFVK